MFQEIAPHEMNITYQPVPPCKDSSVVCYCNQQLLLCEGEKGLTLPTVEQAEQIWGISPEELIYLLSVDGAAFYLTLERREETAGFAYQPFMKLREAKPGWLAFACVTAAHMAHWYENNRFCGRCTTPMEHLEKERALRCPKCGRLLFPRISPVVIVGVTDGERLLLTRYSNTHSTYRGHALIAGFVEIGETFEDTIRREVMEEVGLRVGHIRYYKSQPWGFSDSLLAGFYADLEGSPEIKVDPDELSEGVWCRRDELPATDSTLSLTAEMMETFRAGNEPN